MGPSAFLFVALLLAAEAGRIKVKTDTCARAVPVVDSVSRFRAPDSSQ